MNKSLKDAIEKAKQDPNGLSDTDLEFIYEQGRADALEEVLNILISDGDYGHETFSLTYLRGLLKQIKEKKK